MSKTLRRAALCVVLALLAGAAGAEPRKLRVGTSGDYPPFSASKRGGPVPGFDGFDLRVAQAFAEERGLSLEVVRFDWPHLLQALGERRFDVAMSGVTVRPERSAAGRFTVPVAETGAVVLVADRDRWRKLEDLDRRAARIGVNAGGHLERVAEGRFRRATLLSIPSNEAVLRALVNGGVDAVVTEQIEAGLWLEQAGDGAGVLGPFTRDRKAYLVRPDAPKLADALDRFLLEREADGTLAELRAAHLKGADPAPVATPLGALLAAVDERLALMPLVGAAKRAEGLPLEVPEREGQVLDAAVAGVLRAAERSRRAPPPEALVRAFFRAQIEAAKQVQWAAVKDDAPAPAPLPSVEATLRPALLRIGERIAALLVALPEGLETAEIGRAALGALHAPYLEPTRVAELAEALARLSQAPRAPQARVIRRAESPAITGSTRHTP